MKCTICGKEFGNGTNCQNCGIDRVQGLASYGGGFSPSTKQGPGTRQRDDKGRFVNANKLQTMGNFEACFACSEIIPNDSEYCPKCGKKLKEKCPKCGNMCSAQFEYCNKCGTNRAEYARELKRKEQEEKKKRKLAEQKKCEAEEAARKQEQIRKQREEEERRRQEEEIRKKSEAEVFRKQVEGECGFLTFMWWLFAVFCVIMWFYLMPYNGVVEWIGSVGFLVGIICGSLAVLSYIQTGIKMKRLEKYKTEHPDDWRIRYW